MRWEGKEGVKKPGKRENLDSVDARDGSEQGIM